MTYASTNPNRQLIEYLLYTMCLVWALFQVTPLDIAMSSFKENSESVRSTSSLVRGALNKPESSSLALNENDSLFVDSIAMLVVCPTHSKLALASLKSHPSKNLWFPIVALPANQVGDYDQALHSLMDSILSTSMPLPRQSYIQPELVHTMRMQVPKCMDYVERFLFRTELAQNKAKCACCSPTNGPNCIVTWYSFQDVIKLPNLHGPEPMIAAAFLLNAGSRAGFPDNCVRSYEISMRKLANAITIGPNSRQLRLVAGVSAEDVQLAYTDYVQHCFPSPYMILRTFRDYIVRVMPNLANEKDVAEMMHSFISNKEGLPYIDFFDFIGGLASLSGKFSPFDQIRRGHLYSALHFKSNAPQSSCGHCRTKKYTLALHYVSVHNRSISGSGLLPILSDIGRMPRASRVNSNDAFSPQFIANKMITIIRDSLLKPFASDFLTPSLRRRLIEPIKTICAQVRTIFESEPRVLRVPAPSYVFGDIHGNLRDLLLYDQLFWKKEPFEATCNFTFLGDYVDRGCKSVEVVLFLFCRKILAPTRFHMLRGNHELRPIQEYFTFQKECVDKFGREAGFDIWETFNRVFDYLPVAGVIDERIYCAHGGIPQSIIDLDEFAQSVPCPMMHPFNECLAAWECLWNDPITREEYNLQLQTYREQHCLSMIESLPDGYLPNTKRGTAFYFSSQATNAFLKANNLSHVLRAHECIPAGFHFHCGGRVVTVFSCSNYCGQANTAAVILVGPNGTIRPIQVETDMQD